MSDFTTAGAARSRFHLGEALEATFEAVFANFGVFLLLALAISALPNLLLTLPFGPRPAAAVGGATAILGGVRGLMNLALTAGLQGALVRGVVTHLNGARPTFAGCLRSGAATLGPLVAIGLLAGLGTAVGFVFLLVPGFILMAVWAVVAPAQVVERRGVFASFSRSVELTRGHRWAVLGAVLVMVVIAFLVLLLGGAVIGLVGGFGRRVAVVSAPSWPLFAADTLINVLATAIGAVFSSTLPAVLYHQLRRSKEGAAPSQLAAVFD